MAGVFANAPNPPLVGAEVVVAAPKLGFPNAGCPKAGCPNPDLPKAGFANPDCPKPEATGGCEGVVLNAEVVAGLGASKALLGFELPKAPNPVAGLTSDPLPNPLDVVSVFAGVAEKEPNMLLRALGSDGVAVPSPKLPNPAVESDIDASRVMFDDVAVVDVSVL